MTPLQIIANCIGIVAIASNIYAVQKNTHFKIMFYKTAGSFLFAVQYVMLGALTGAMMDGIGIVRNIIFTRQVQQKRSTKFSIILFSILTLVLGSITIALSFNTSIDNVSHISKNYNTALLLVIMVSIFSIVAKVISCISYGIDSPHLIRVLGLISSALWLLYNFIFLSITGVLNEVFVISSIIIAEIRFYKPKQNPLDIENESENTKK